MKDVDTLPAGPGRRTRVAVVALLLGMALGGVVFGLGPELRSMSGGRGRARNGVGYVPEKIRKIQETLDKIRDLDRRIARLRQDATEQTGDPYRAVLGPCADAEAWTPRIAKLLLDGSEAVRIFAAEILGSYGDRALDAVPELTVALEDVSPSVRIEAALSRWMVTGEIQPSMSVLLAGIEAEEVEVRVRTAEVLETMGEAAASATPALRRALNDPDPAIRLAAALALLAIGTDRAGVRPVLSAALRESPVVRDRMLAANGLGKIGPETSPDLLAALRDEHAPVRGQAIVSLADVGCDEAVPALLELAEDPDRFVRLAAETALRILDDASPSPVAGLIHELGHGEEAIRPNAAALLGRLGHEAHDAVSDLARMLRTAADPDTRYDAAHALHRIGSGSITALPALREAFERDPVYRVRYEAAEAIRAIEGKPAAGD